MPTKVQILVFDELDRPHKQYTMSADTFGIDLGVVGRSDTVEGYGLVTEITVMQKYEYYVTTQQGRVAGPFPSYKEAQDWMRAKQIEQEKENTSVSLMMTIETSPEL